MTREVAEKIVRGITDKIECNTADMHDWAEFWGFTIEEYEEYLDMSLKALEKTDVPDTNVGDLINRQAVLNLFNKSDEYRLETRWIKRKIEKLPSVVISHVRKEVEAWKPLPNPYKERSD